MLAVLSPRARHAVPAFGREEALDVDAKRAPRQPRRRVGGGGGGAASAVGEQPVGTLFAGAAEALAAHAHSQRATRPIAVGGAAVMVRVRVQPRHVVVVVVQPIATGPLCPRLVTDVHGALAAGEQRELLDPPPVRTAPPLAR